MISVTYVTLFRQPSADLRKGFALCRKVSESIVSVARRGKVVGGNVVYRGLHRRFLLTVLLLWNGLDVLHEKIIQEL